jgi:hypothetical protein
MITNSALLTRERALSDWLKAGFLATFFLAACWGGVIAYWRTNGSNPQTRELLLYLLGLPACLFLAFFAGRKFLTRASAAAPALAASSTPAKAVAASSGNKPLAIVAASLRLPHGASPEELAAAIAGNKARADLDKELVDDGGFPVMTARSSEAVDEVLQEQVAEWLALNGMAEVHFSDEQWRALTLASAVVSELAAQAGPMLYQVDTQAKLQLMAMMPTEWDAVCRHAVSRWLKHTVARYGWPADRVTLTTDDLTPSAAFQRFADDAAPANGLLIAMVVACASHIGDDTVAQWAADGSLFTSSRPQGRIPGEGAVGLLVTNQANLADAAAVALLDGVEEAKRNTTADEGKRGDPGILKELTERALQRSGVAAPEVAMLIADTGHRSSRVLELMGHVSADLPQLDETADVVRVGVGSGSCGAVPFMAALALGRHYVLEHGAPMVCVSNEDSYRRVVALVRSSDPHPRAE